MTSNYTIWIGFFILLLTLSGICLWYTIKKYKHRYWEDYEFLSALLLVFVGTLIGGIVFINSFAEYRGNRLNEAANYNALMAEGQTLTDALTVSNDIIKNDLYLAISNYNQDVTRWKAYYTSPRFSYNFTGDYDWMKIPYINISEVLERK